ncbi:MAG: class I SAM-dependent methyltransferase, partial [Clostridiales bacterium]|nr:class I SAM-dependent methyltransferase [Clostridiales bacterium]
METIGSKPTGWLGRRAGQIMNFIHHGAYKKIIDHHISDMLAESDQNHVLDIGCGGGIAVKIFSKNKRVIKVIGIDYSEEMVKLSQKINKKAIIEG